MSGLETVTWIRHIAENVARDGYTADDGTRPYPWEKAQAEHLVRVGDGAAWMNARNSWELRGDNGSVHVVFFSETPYELQRWRGWIEFLPTKNESTYEFRYAAADVAPGLANRPDLVWIRQQIIDLATGELFYESSLRMAEREGHEALLDQLNAMPYPYYMYTPNFADMTPEQAAGYKRIVEKSVLTPAEAAELTNTHESGWRNRAAAGEIPGAFKKGKQWLIPRSAVEVSDE